ncbi:LppM family (lipo)protein [Brevibacterium luteolum]|uniref:LppM domain-containing protein n=1 Tax=Brevibacterium luteolum TaxID=199591 RepID=A0A6G8KX45_9MICO|nr:hypothetical protein [Brevibacterium luteolum]QIN29384.1 hypothetical protein EW640_08920 [Brevibacterium luteolum]
MTETRRRTTRPLAAVLLLVITFMLTGCIKLNGDLMVDKDLTVSGTIDLLIERTALDEMAGYEMDPYGPGATDPDSTIDEAIDDAREDSPPGMTVSKISEEDYIGARFTLDSVDPDRADTGAFWVQGMTITETDDEIQLSMPNFLVRNPSSGPSFAATRFMYDEATMRFTFPGRVVSAPGGEVKGKTVIYDLTSYDEGTITVAAKKSSFPWWILYIVGGVLLLAIIAGIIIAVVARRKRQRQAMPPGAGYSAPGYGAAAPGMPGPGGPAYAGPGHGPAGPPLGGPGYSGPSGSGRPPSAGPGVVPPQDQQMPPHGRPGPYGQPAPHPSGPPHSSGAPHPQPGHGPGQQGMQHPGPARPGPQPAPPDDHRRFAPPESRKRMDPPGAS